MVDLSEYDDAYDDAEVHDGFSPIPDGTYQVFVDEVAVKETKEKHLPMIAWKFKIINGQHEGRVLFKNSVITEKTLSYIKTDLSICGIILEKFSEIQTYLFDLLNKNLEVKIVSKDDNQNIYIQRVLKHDDTEQTNADDIPF